MKVFAILVFLVGCGEGNAKISVARSPWEKNADGIACHDYAWHVNDYTGAHSCPRPEHTMNIVVAEDEHLVVCRCPR